MYIVFFLLIGIIGYGSLLSRRLGILLVGMVCVLILMFIPFTDVNFNDTNTHTVTTISTTKNATNNQTLTITKTNTTSTDNNVITLQHSGDLEFTAWVGINMLVLTVMAMRLFQIQTVDGWRF